MVVMVGQAKGVKCGALLGIEQRFDKKDTSRHHGGHADAKRQGFTRPHHTRSRRVGLGLDCERASIGVLWVSTTVPGKPHTLYLRWDVIAVAYL